MISSPLAPNVLLLDLMRCSHSKLPMQSSWRIRRCDARIGKLSMKTLLNSPRSFGLAALLIGGLAAASQAATISISPASISNSFSGNLTIQIGGLTNGETVLVERFLDLNTNGIIDAAEPLVQSFKLTDGQVSSIGGVRNGNIPGDNDLGTNSQIT